MSDFLERFKNKTSKLSAEGEIHLSETHAVGKPFITSFQKSERGGMINTMNRFNTQTNYQFAKPISISRQASAAPADATSTKEESFQSEFINASEPLAVIHEPVEIVKQIQEKPIINRLSPRSIKSDFKAKSVPSKPVRSVRSTKSPIIARSSSNSARLIQHKTQAVKPKRLMTQSESSPNLKIVKARPTLAPIENPPRPPKRTRPEIDPKEYTKTLSSFRKLSKKWESLGSLGAGNIGGEIWTKEKDALDRRSNYSKEVSLKNTNITTRSSHDDSQAVSSEYTTAFIMKQRAIQYSQTIKKPKLQIQNRKGTQKQQQKQQMYLQQENSKYIETLAALAAQLQECD